MRTPSSVDLATRDLGIRALQRLSAGSTSSIERVGDILQIRGPETLSPALTPHTTAKRGRSAPVQGLVGGSKRVGPVGVACATLLITRHAGRVRQFREFSPPRAATNSPTTRRDRTGVGQFLARKRPNGPVAHPLVATVHLADIAPARFSMTGFARTPQDTGDDEVSPIGK